MVHAVSATYLRFEHMSPPAAGMALLLHASIALALWWISPLKFSESDPQPIEVTMEAPTPKPAEPPQELPPSAPAQPQAAPPPTTTVPQRAAPQQLGLPPPPPPGTAQKAGEAQPKQIEQQQQQQQAVAPPRVEETKPPEPEPQPTPPPIDKVLPKVDTPPPPLTMQDFVKIAPPPPPREIVKPLPQQVTPPPPPQPRQALRPSPLSSAPQTSPENNRGGGSNTFVNPAEVYVQSHAADEYKWAVIRKFSQYLPNLRQRNEGGTLVLRIAIGRDGHLLEATVLRSSGVPALDQGMIEAIKTASPYPPLPGDIPGDRFTFTQDIIAKQ